MRKDPFFARAFSLLEVLAALAIFALMAVVLAGSYVNVLNGYAIAARSRETDEDAAFACQQLLVEPDVDKAREGDQFDSAEGHHVVWTATIDPTTTADLFTVTFACNISGAGLTEDKKVTRTFTLLRPTWSDPAERSKLLQDAKDRIADLQSKTANGFSPADTGSSAGGFPVGVAAGGRGGKGAGGGGGDGGPGNGNRGNRGPPGGGGTNRGPTRNDGTVPVAPPNNGGNPSRGTGGGGNRNNPARSGNPPANSRP